MQPSKTSIDTLIEYVEILGNSGHELRSIIAQVKRPEIPDLTAIDIQFAVTENQVREILILLAYDKAYGIHLIKPKFKNIYRNLQSILRVMGTFNQASYQVLTPEKYQQIEGQVNMNIQIVQKIDQHVNNMFSSFLEESEIQNKKLKDIVNDQYKAMVGYLDFNQNLDYAGKEANLNNLISYCKDVCNRAHYLQTVISPLMVGAGKAQAEAIVNIAGGIEDQFREVLNKMDIHRDEFPKMKEGFQVMNQIVGQQTSQLGQQMLSLVTICQDPILQKVQILISILEISQTVLKQIEQSQDQLRFRF